MKVKKLVLKTFYSLDGELLVFPQNPLHNATYENVNVKIEKGLYTVAGENYAVDVVSIEGHEPIECELISRRKNPDGTMVLSICQDWG